MATRTKKRSAKRRARGARVAAKAGARARKAAKPRRSSGNRKPLRAQTKGRAGRGRHKPPIKRAKTGAARAAESHARKAGVMPEGAPGSSAASGRMHAVPTREQRASKPRPAGATRQQRKKATGDSGFGFKQIEERYTTTRGKTGIAAEPRRIVREVDEEVEERGVEQGQPAAGFVDYDRQEHTGDEEEGEAKVDVEAPAAEEE